MIKPAWTNHTAGELVNQFFEPEEEEWSIEEEESIRTQTRLHRWVVRILAVFLLIIFLTPIILSAVQIALQWAQPQVQPTPFRLQDLLHG